MAEARKAVEDLTRLSSRVIRILGQNPGPYTLAGTNTYLVSPPSSARGSLASRASILVDTGEGCDGYIPLLERALKGAPDAESHPNPAEMEEEEEEELKSWISDIVLTHKHHDHVGGLPSVLSLLSKLRAEATVTLPAPRIHKLPDPDSDPALLARLQKLPRGSFIPCDHQDGPLPIWPLAERSEVSVSSEDGQSTTLQVVHTPGHTADHICLLLREDKVLLTGDHVLGQGTTVFEDLTAYMSSLRKCSQILEELGPGDTLEKENQLYPAHGPVVSQGRQTLSQYLQHRLEREAQVVHLLKLSPDNGANPPASRLTDAGYHLQLGAPWKIRQIVLKLYSNYPEHLFPAAARGIFLHLRALSSPDPDQDRPSQVRCLQTASFAQRSAKTNGASSDPGNCPPLPHADQDWLEAMDLEWSLILDRTATDDTTNGVPAQQRL